MEESGNRNVVITKEILEKLYIEEKKSTRDCASSLGIPYHQTIRKLLKEFSIPIRGKNESLKGKRFTEEHKEKLSNAKKGKPVNEACAKACIGRIPWNKGIGSITHNCQICYKEFTDKIYRRNRFCSAKCRNAAKGEIHWNYVGKETRGVQTRRHWKQYREFRNSVLERDNYKCFLCNKNQFLIVHHIEAWSTNIELRFEPSNGITCCKDCHSKIHKNCGQKKYDSTKFKLEYL